jgi:hypothetical protein
VPMMTILTIGVADTFGGQVYRVTPYLTSQ